MAGRVIFFATVCVALALLGSFFLLNRLPAPAPVSAAGATGAAADEAPSAEPPQRESSDYREALLKADRRGQYCGRGPGQRGSGADAHRHGRKRRLHLRFDGEAAGT